MKDEKKCYRCQKSKNIKEFYKNKFNWDGLNSCCKMCSLERAKERREINKKRAITSMEEKECRKCHQIKKSEEFSGDRIQRDGKNIYCKECKKELNRRGREKSRQKELGEN